MRATASNLDPDLTAVLLAFAREMGSLTAEEQEERLLEAFGGDEEAVARFVDRLSGRGQG